METSAKDGNNVNKLFCEIGKTLYKAQELKNNINKVSIILQFDDLCIIFSLNLQDVNPEILKNVKLKIQNTKNKKSKKCC